LDIYFAAPKWGELDILRDEGATNVLMSFGEPKCFESLDKALRMGFKVLVDSGAYSAFTMGRHIDIADYAAALRQYAAHVEAYVNLDVCNSAEETAANQAWLEGQGFAPMPVYHYGEDEGVLASLVAKYPYIGLGSSALAAVCPKPQRRKWFAALTARHNVRFHGFAVGELRPEHAGLFSVDSTTWSVGARFGRHIGRQGTVQTAKYGLFWTRKELLRHNTRAILWQGENLQASPVRQMALEV
jgi:hypothetical protein